MVKIPRMLCGVVLSAGLTLSGWTATAFAADKAVDSGTSSVERFLPPSLQSKPTKDDAKGASSTGGQEGVVRPGCSTCSQCGTCCVNCQNDTCSHCGHCRLRGHDFDLEAKLHDDGRRIRQALHDRLNRERLRARFGYFIPEGSCGQGTPIAGAYHMAYAVNPYHFDPRDGGVYAAQGWGVPMSVPLAPNVEHQYNYGWGIPSSRLTGIYRYVREPGIVAPVGGPSAMPGVYPLSYPRQHPFVGNFPYREGTAPVSAPIVEGMPTK